jgi:hypothetical protein
MLIKVNLRNLLARVHAKNRAAFATWLAESNKTKTNYIKIAKVFDKGSLRI